MDIADRLRAATLCAAILGAGPLAAEPCARAVHYGAGYTVCTIEAGADLRLFLTAPDGRAYGSFDRLAAAVAASGGRLVMAMNGGMYHADRSPVGLYIEDGTARAPVVTGPSRDNFGMLPNGIFCILPEGFAVIETRRYLARPPACRHATQSGPMLLIDGALHPRFIPDSASRFVRNGVGVSADGRRAYLVISDGRVSFDAFARLFRDRLGVRDALYLDGNISRLYAPGIGRRDFGLPMGPIVGLVVPAGSSGAVDAPVQGD
ncbi:MAG: phosphodiester glycosidase family protein [Gemmobacter sp.]